MGTNYSTQEDSTFVTLRLFSVLMRLRLYEPPREHCNYQYYTGWIKSIEEVVGKISIPRIYEESSVSKAKALRAHNETFESYKRMFEVNPWESTAKGE